MHKDGHTADDDFQAAEISSATPGVGFSTTVSGSSFDKSSCTPKINMFRVMI